MAGLWKLLAALQALIVCVFAYLAMGAGYAPISVALLIVGVPLAVLIPLTVAEALERSERIETLLKRLAGPAPEEKTPTAVSDSWGQI